MWNFSFLQHLAQVNISRTTIYCIQMVKSTKVFISFTQAQFEIGRLHENISISSRYHFNIDKYISQFIIFNILISIFCHCTVIKFVNHTFFKKSSKVKI